MIKGNLDIIEFSKWNRKILNVYWLIIMIVSLTELILFFVDCNQVGYVDFQYLKINVIKPVLINSTILIVTNMVYASIKEKSKEGVKYLIIICSTLLVYTIVYVHYEVDVIYVLFIFPIFLSEIYRNKKLTCFTTLLNLICYLAILFLYLPTRPVGAYHHTIYEIYTVICLIISTFIIVLSFIDRAKEIMESFIEINQSKQELTIQNFIMEFNSKMEPTTGLYNHKTFYEYLEHLIKQSEHYGFSLSLAVIDIDNFKRVNDTYGHSLGDEVIKALTETIKENIDADDYAARYGGEEFAIIFTDKNKEKAFDIAEKIRLKFNNVSINEMKNEKFGASIGISGHVSGMSRQTFFSNADAALYKAKKSGKNTTIVYNE